MKTDSDISELQNLKTHLKHIKDLTESYENISEIISRRIDSFLDSCSSPSRNLQKIICAITNLLHVCGLRLLENTRIDLPLFKFVLE